MWERGNRSESRCHRSVPIAQITARADARAAGGKNAKIDMPTRINSAKKGHGAPCVPRARHRTSIPRPGDALIHGWTSTLSSADLLTLLRQEAPAGQNGPKVGRPGFEPAPSAFEGRRDTTTPRTHWCICSEQTLLDAFLSRSRRGLSSLSCKSLGVRRTQTGRQNTGGQAQFTHRNVDFQGSLTNLYIF